MFGAFKPSSPLSGGLLWKIPWRLSPPQKARQRGRLRRVDNVVATVDKALARAGINGTVKLNRWKEEMPTEAEMFARDKYTVFGRYERGYRKGIHKVPKWTRVSQRLNPPGF
ncbi:mitochondrial ribosomal protein-like protein subunit L31 [Phyllosticta citriasiana]|uniref:Large ribosomal subunit protein mL60 n=1 Tax=Phyllosticta citriasiana TaxID=595635 RepID=A0ABR1KKD8_9PEZI